LASLAIFHGWAGRWVNMAAKLSWCVGGEVFF